MATITRWSTGSAMCSAVLRSPLLPSEPLLALRSANQLPFFDQGFVLDDLEEPIYEDTAEGVERFSWRNYTEIPPALVARVRLVG